MASIDFFDGSKKCDVKGDTLDMMTNIYKCNLFQSEIEKHLLDFVDEMIPRK